MLKTGLLFVAGVALLGGLAYGQAQDTAAAKTRVISNRALKTNGEKRNVEATGHAGLYTKASALTGEKTVASKRTMEKLDQSTNPEDYLRAYRVAKTNRGQVYYKVVSFDGDYRGWVYGGKKVNRFAGGVSQADTTKELPLASAEKNQTYEFSSPGTKNVTWRAAYGSNYKPQKVVQTTKPYADDDLQIKSAVQLRKGGSVYYYVASSQHPKVNGWVYSKAVRPQNEAESSVTPESPSIPETSVTPEVPGQSENNQGNQGGPSLSYSGSFSHTDALVYKNANSQETDKAVIEKVQKTYKENVIKSLPEPFKYDQSMPIEQVYSKLGHGKRFVAEGGRNYVVVADPTASSPVKLIPYTAVKWINPGTNVGGLDTGILSWVLNDDLKSKISTGINLLYKANYLGSLVIMSPMSDSTVKSLLGDGKTLKLNVEPFFEQFPLVIKFDIKVNIERDDNGIKAVKVDLTLDPESLKAPKPENPANHSLNIKMGDGFSFVEKLAIQAGVRLLYPQGFPYYNNIDQKMSVDKIKRVLGDGMKLPIDQEISGQQIKADLEISVDVVQEGGLSKDVKVTVAANKPAAVR